ncbi:hypothetical protein L0V05_06710 [Tabrizicola sp. J26]|uniref:hypothetical protein n=1 Tax=Alitabrizicola rongguiensis TaxID=2909234 RepID=UPI001F2516DD|nr:hypothetical protein [Tabrizicola rongguiensis]MCF1708504.1 hypothetical protein [Tabrizicola rongguiensis]
MTSATFARGFYAIPFFGWIARDISRDINNVWYALVILLTALALAVKTWGLVALAMTALAMVPVMFVLLIMITRG